MPICTPIQSPTFSRVSGRLPLFSRIRAFPIVQELPAVPNAETSSSHFATSSNSQKEGKGYDTPSPFPHLVLTHQSFTGSAKLFVSSRSGGAFRECHCSWTLSGDRAGTSIRNKGLGCRALTTT